MSLFAIQHSVMARQGFKRWWTQFVPPAVERSTYVLLASLALILLFWQWRPIPTIVWQVADPTLAMALTSLSLFGWLVVLTSTFLINHFELFGLHQVVNNLARPAHGRGPLQDAGAVQAGAPSDLSRLHHRVLGGAGDDGRHLLFAAVTTAYIFVGIMLEERDLVALFGDEYRAIASGSGCLSRKPIPLPKQETTMT